MTPVQQGARLVPTAPGTLARDYAVIVPCERQHQAAYRIDISTGSMPAYDYGSTDRGTVRPAASTIATTSSPTLYALVPPSSTAACGTARATAGGCMESEGEHACRICVVHLARTRVDRSLVHARPAATGAGRVWIDWIGACRHGRSSGPPTRSRCAATRTRAAWPLCTHAPMHARPRACVRRILQDGPRPTTRTRASVQPMPPCPRARAPSVPHATRPRRRRATGRGRGRALGRPC